MADFMCVVLNVTLCLMLLAVGVLVVSMVWLAVRGIVSLDKED